MPQQSSEDDLSSIVDRLDELADQVARLTKERTPPEDEGWFATTAAQVFPGDGGVAHGGRVRLPDEREAVWQLGHTTEDLLDDDWAGYEAPLRALGHRHRLELLRELVDHPMTALQLVETGRHGTSGQVYNHLRQLVDAGWLASERRGTYGVPIQRVVPLLVILSSCRQ